MCFKVHIGVHEDGTKLHFVLQFRWVQLKALTVIRKETQFARSKIYKQPAALIINSKYFQHTKKSKIKLLSINKEFCHTTYVEIYPQISAHLYWCSVYKTGDKYQYIISTLMLKTFCLYYIILNPRLIKKDY